VVTLPLSNTWQYPVQTMTVLLHYLDAGVAKSVSVQNVWKRSEDLSEAQTDPAMIEVTRCHFHVWTEKLPAGVVPVKGDEVEEGGRRWKVDHSELLGHGTRHRLHCFLERP